MRMVDEINTNNPDEIIGSELKEFNNFIENDLIPKMEKNLPLTDLEKELAHKRIVAMDTDIKQQVELFKQIKIDRKNRKNYRKDRKEKTAFESVPYNFQNNDFCNIKYLKFKDPEDKPTLTVEYFVLTYNNYENWYQLQHEGLLNNEDAMDDLLNDLFSINKDLGFNADSDEILNFLNDAVTNGETTKIQTKLKNDNNLSSLYDQKDELKKSFLSLSGNDEKRIRGLGNLAENILQVVIKVINETEDSDQLYYLNIDDGLKCYDPLTNQIKDKFLLDVFDDENLVTTKQLDKGLEYGKDRVKTCYHTIKFKNVVYDISKFEVLKNHKPLLPSLNVNYKLLSDNDIKYNSDETLSNPKYQEVEDYIKYTFEEDANAFYEVVGYSFDSGNLRNILIILTGIEGAGKSAIKKILVGILSGVEKPLDKLFSSFGTSNIEGKTFISIPDVEDKEVDNLKALISGEGWEIEQKYKDSKELPEEETPIMILQANQIPVMKLDQAMLDRLPVFHFKNKIRYTDSEDPKFAEHFLADDEKCEYLIYRSIKQYKEMVDSGSRFKILDKTNRYLKMNMVGSSVLTALEKIIKPYDSEYDQTEYAVYANELNKAVMGYAIDEKITIEKTKGQDRVKDILKYVKEFLGIDDSNIPYATEKEAQTSRRYYPDLTYNLRTDEKATDGELWKDYYIGIYDEFKKNEHKKLN